MKIKNSSFLALFAFILIGCSKKIDFKINCDDKLQINKTLSIQTDISDPVDEITYYLNDKKIGTGKILDINIQDYKLGKQDLKVTVKSNDKSVSKKKTILFLADKAPKILNFEVINSYPHDTKAFTQGLEFYKEELFESTGQRGASNIRKVDLNTGKVLQQQDIAKQYFGEGITIFNHAIHQLTWESKLGFTYDANTLKPTGQFNYQNSKEGWGLTHNDTQLIKSDGTEKIWFLNPENHHEESYIEVYTDKRKVDQINELEYVNGKIYANVWMKNAILIINPKNGAIESIINMKSLTQHLDDKSIANDHNRVLNGIAYHTNSQKLYVTGKYWDKLFEIKITE